MKNMFSILRSVVGSISILCIITFSQFASAFDVTCTTGPFAAMAKTHTMYGTPTTAERSWDWIEGNVEVWVYWDPVMYAQAPVDEAVNPAIDQYVQTLTMNATIIAKMEGWFTTWKSNPSGYSSDNDICSQETLYP